MAIHPSRGVPLVRVTSGTIGAIAADAVLDLNIRVEDQGASVQTRIGPRQGGLHSKETSVSSRSGLLRGTIEDLTFYWVNTTSIAPHATIHFWANDSHNTSDLSVIKLWGTEDLTGGDFIRQDTAATNSIWHAFVGDLNIPYADEDRTGEFHVTVENNGTDNWAADKSLLEFGFRTEWGA